MYDLNEIEESAGVNVLMESWKKKHEVTCVQIIFQINGQQSYP